MTTQAIMINMEEETTIKTYLDEELEVTITRRELYWLRAQSRKRLEAAAQGMNAVASSPAKRSMRREEYEFHSALIGRLYGVEPNEEERQALIDAENAARALEMKQRAERLRKQADALINSARELVNDDDKYAKLESI